MKKITFIFISIVLILNSCKREDPTEPTNLTITTDTTDTTNPKNPTKYYNLNNNLYPFLFDKESYWVYEKTNSKIRDSIYVLSISKDIVYPGPTGPSQGSSNNTAVVYYNIKYYSTLENKTNEEFLSSQIISKKLFSEGILYISTKKIGDELWNAKIQELIDTMTISNKNYKNIVKMRANKDLYLNNSFNLYYVDSVGIIKKELLINDSIIETWNLIKFNTKLL